MKERRESHEKNGVLSAMVLNDVHYYIEEIEEATDILASDRKDSRALGAYRNIISEN
ncbi:LOW QUALITY PROTEIN: hypothetical protein YC2023_113949 [Brassica napus]